jgi:hypothetical protein
MSPDFLDEVLDAELRGGGVGVDVEGAPEGLGRRIGGQLRT